MKQHPSYRRLVELAERSHRAGRNILGIAQADIDLARLYCYAFRGQVIGSFHATRLALESASGSRRAIENLQDLADLSAEPIQADARALVSTFLRYQRGILRVWEEVQDAGAIGERFRRSMETITACNGIVLTQDTHAPAQASFVVPNLGITIVPLVYGDYHSWNLAWLDGERSDVPFHRHHEGVEIHLGYSPIHGETVLGGCRAEVREGYAMPIPPATAHGYVNRSAQQHHVPFIYGSLKAGGWGVFLDVEPQPRELPQLAPADITSAAMNGSIRLEREIEQAAEWKSSWRSVLIPAERTSQAGCGGLELGLLRVAGELPLFVDSYRIVSVVRGTGQVELNGIQQTLEPHDHFGIPAGLKATLRGEALIALDALIR